MSDEIQIGALIETDLNDPNFVSFATRCTMGSQTTEIGFQVLPEEILKAILIYVNDSDKIMLVAKDKEQYVGCLFGHVCYYPFTKGKVVGEKYFRIDNEYRGKGINKRLMEALKDWGKSNGATILTMGVKAYAGDNFDLACKSLENEGMKLFHKAYFMEI